MKFPRAFYLANTLEIFERLAWYGFFTLSSLYMTSPREQGGMAFSDAERGFLQGLIPFLLYLFPVITGALADRYGYKRLFWISFFIMCPGYYCLGLAENFWSFFFAFLAVAIGAACFKPVVLGTISRSTNDTNRGLGFGIFYTMVNIGGFLGPFLAGFMRAISWDWVFIMSALWIAINMVILGCFYREPKADLETVNQLHNNSLSATLLQAQEVLGNGRLALLIAPLIIGLMLASKGTIELNIFGWLATAWLGLNWAWSKWLASSSREINKKPCWLQQPIKTGNKKFLTYLLILSGFWTVYNQLFFTLPLYIRDFVDTKDLVLILHHIHPALANFMAQVNLEQLHHAISNLDVNLGAEIWRETLVHHKVMVPLDSISAAKTALSDGHITTYYLAENWALHYRQVNPEYIINLDFGAIIIFQVLLSHWLQRFNAIAVISAGTIILAFSNLLGGIAHLSVMSGFLVVAGVLVFALGEMIASPKSQEYVAALAPPQKEAVYMGYYFISMALGMLFAGLLSGWAYGTIAKTYAMPVMMWALFAVIGLISALGLFLFNQQECNIDIMPNAIQSEAT